MTRCKEALLWLTVFSFCHISRCEETTTIGSDLDGAEAKDGKLEIIKTIKKVNDDGSYTIGYEADDGSFKIESRDVLGNIKGTYGYVDDDGEIKRISYSSTNASDFSTEAPTVVQRPTKTNRTYLVPRRPGVLLYNPTTVPTPTSTSVIQPIPRRKSRTNTTTTTTEKTTKNSTPSVVYATSVPRTFQYSKPATKATTPIVEVLKSEGQLLRPEISTTELPIFRRLKNPILNTETPSTIKPVAEEPEDNSNILRRQLHPEINRNQLLSVQHNGQDVTDVYGGSLPSGTPRPLFTTTIRSRVLSTPNTLSERSTYSTPKFHISTKRTTKPEYTQETTTDTITQVNPPTSLPVVQLQQNEENPQLVAVKHPFHRGLVLVPVNQLQGNKNPNVHYFLPNDQPQYISPSTTASPNIETQQNPVPVYVQRNVYPPMLRSMPIQVDPNGYIRSGYQNQVLSVPITPAPRVFESTVQNEVDRIKPPVSTKDFQRLLEQLTMRQSRLEKVNALLHEQRQRELQQSRYHHQVQPNLLPLFVPRRDQTRSPTFIPQPNLYLQRPNQGQQEFYLQDPTSYTPTKRVARLLPEETEKNNNGEEEYLPAHVREMLLLRMLQLAINPALPLDGSGNEEYQEESATQVEPVKIGVRNVEVLGEESEEEKKLNRIKRFRNSLEDMYQEQ